MYGTKKEVDNHVRSAFQKLSSEKDRALRGFTIAKLYFRIKEYAAAEQHLCAYLNVKEDNDQAHKLLAQCYQQSKQPLKALQAFQRSLQLNPKQPDVLGEVCQLFVDDDQMSANKAEYWCKLAESEKVENEAVYALRLKLVNATNGQASEIESILQKEISSRPNDINPRVRLVRHYLDQTLIVDAFKYVHDFEMQQNDAFTNSSEWYNIVWLVLSKYEQLNDVKKDWDFWLLVAICLERLVFISFIASEFNGSGSNDMALVTETANLLFRFDQYLFKITQLSKDFSAQRELVQLFLDHFRGQLLLHAVALLFKRELMQRKNKWRETLQLALPLLLFAFQIEPKENNQPWMKHCDENGAKLILLWYREGAFRCAQAGRTLYACISEENKKKENELQINNAFSTQSNILWSDTEQLLAQIRKICADKYWRHNLFAQLFCNSDQKLKEKTSLLMKSPALAEPNFEIPSYAALEVHEDAAQYLRPQSLRHMVYLGLCYDNLSHVRAKYFSGLNFSTTNLAFCGAESLNQLDIDTYLCAAIIEAQRTLAVQREMSDCYHTQSQSSLDVNCRPRILPFVNVQEELCSEEQRNWWLIAYKVYKNLTKHENPAQMRSDLQMGIEVVRGLNGPRMEMIIVFKLGHIFEQRAKHTRKPVERTFVEARTESLYKRGLNMFKMHHRNLLEPFRKTFKYPKSNSSAVEREINEIAEVAVIYIAKRMMKEGQYEEFIEEMNGVQLPFAVYKKAEAYRKLEEASTTPKSARHRYSARANECLQQTLTLLKNTNIDPNHPLNSTIQSELKRSQQHHNSSRKYSHAEDEFEHELSLAAITSAHNNSSTYEDAESEYYSPQLNHSLASTAAASAATRRDVIASLVAAAQQQQAATAPARSQYNAEMETLVKQMASTLSLVKDELLCTIKPELISMRQETTSLRQEVASLKEKVALMDDSMKKLRMNSGPPSRDDGSHVLDDLYIIEDMQNQLYSQQTPQSASLFSGGAAAGLPPSQQQQSTQQQRIQTPNALQMQQQVAAAAAVYNSPIFNPNYLPNYYASPYMLAQQGAGAVNPLLTQRSQLGLPPYMESTTNGINFNVAPTTTLFPPTAAGMTAVQSPAQTALEGRTNNIFSLPPAAVATAPAQLAQPTLPTLPAFSLPAAAVQPPPQPTVAPTPSATFNKALNNQPVEKGPPANVVITSSDPLPNPRNATQMQQQQPTLSVIIPPHHIKQSLVPPTAETNVATTTTMANTTVSTSPGTYGGNSSFGQSSTLSFGSSTALGASSNFMSDFSFKPAVQQALAAAAALNVKGDANTSAGDLDKGQPGKATAILGDSSTSSELNRTLDTENVEYDPRPDFQPIIPLPDEIEIRTGEEDEEVMFCEHAKLYRHVDKEWKERGIGMLKILKNKDGHSRILMRRDQTHKICANHKITKDLQLTPKLEKKGHTWAAPDFADGEVKSEVFFVRFKLAETAQKFYDAFKQAQHEAVEKPTKVETPQITPQAPFDLTKSPAISFATSTPSSKTDFSSSSIGNSSSGGGGLLPKPSNSSTQQPFGVNMTTSTTTATKPLFGGLNLSTNTDSSPAAAATAVNNEAASKPFANFTFGKISGTGPAATTMPNISTPFSNLFNKTTQQTTTPFSVASFQFPSFGSGTHITTATATTNSVDSPIVESQAANLNKSTTSDTEDDYVPTAQFKPVIPLPELVEVTTGEEDYITLFEHRAKLLRYDKDTREWKERGLGNIRVLQNKANPDDVRILMRREQVHKLCCNQRLNKNTEFKYAKDSKTAVQWIGHDYSEGELVTETMTLRFKLPETCKQFLDVVAKAQQKMSNESNKQATITESQPTTTTAPPAIKTPPVTSSEVKGFGDAFKPKAGSWTCKDCYTNNAADKLYCLACEAPKDDTVPKKTAAAPASIFGTAAPKGTFSFGFGPAATAANTAASAATTTTTASTVFGLPSSGANVPFTFGTKAQATSAAPISSSTTTSTAPAAALPKQDFGDKFKPKPGSWTCTDCYTNNAADKTHCLACEAPKDGSGATQKDTSLDSSGNKDILALSDPTQKFSFGFPPTVAVRENIPRTEGAGTTLFGAAPVTVTSTTSLSKSAFTFSLASKAISAPAMPTDDSSKDGTFAAPFSLDKKTFSFSMPKPKGVDYSNSSGDIDAGDAADADDNALLHEEENNTYFTPVIPLPDKIDVKTGEEDEEVLYQHRAKLYRYIDTEWKERGLGDVKILRHKKSKKLRVMMRREQVHKICLNHVLNNDVEYKSKDDKSWLFVVNDFSDGEVKLEKLSLRFKTKEIAEAFMSAVKSALSADDNTGNVNGHEEITPAKVEGNKQPDNRAIDFVTPVKKNEASTAPVVKVKSAWPLVQPDLKLPPKSQTTPNNRSFALKQSALNLSTPSGATANQTMTVSKEADVSSTIGNTSTIAASPVEFSFAAAMQENEEAQKKTVASGGFLFGNSSSASGAVSNAFGSSIFSGTGSAAVKPVFGQPSIFGNAKPQETNVSASPVAGNNTTASIFSGKSIFGNTAAPTANLFSGVAKPGSTAPLFGVAKNEQQTSLFGGTNNAAPTGATIFGNAPTFGAFSSNTGGIKNGSIFGGVAVDKQHNKNAAAADSTTKPFSFVDFSSKAGGLDFASLAAASNNNATDTQSAEKPAAGGFVGLTNQDAFSNFRKESSNKQSSANLSATSDTNANDPDNVNDDDEKYDPHYEPIIALPNEIVVSTGEENEEKIFSERAVLFRYDTTNKEWKERGVGELKILKHSTRGSYRLVLRREQVHKLVLNFAITPDFKYSNMNKNPKSFAFAGMNFAESEAGECENLAVRFKKLELAEQFDQELKKCMEIVRQQHDSGQVNE